MIAATAKSTEIPLNKIFTSRKANDWIQKAAKHRTPKKLFGDYWHEGEIALLFSDAGAGKSLLAVQIADAIAGGRQVPPILTSVRAQNVLYLDFKHSDKQFESRYVGSDGKHYRFQERFYRVEADPNAVNRADLLPAIERLIEETKTKVLIIDNVTYLKRKYNGWDDQLELIRWLRQLKIRKGVSILLLAPIQRRGGKRALQLADLRGTSMLGDFADSVFAIGRCGGSESGRYLKAAQRRERLRGK